MIRAVYFDENIQANDFPELIESKLSLLRRDKVAKRHKKTQKSQTKLQEFVVVAFVEDLEQARDYETLLKTNDIPAVISEQDEQSIGAKGIAVMVPEDFLDEAHVIIESQDAYDDFCNFALEDDGNFDADLLDDDV